MAITFQSFKTRSSKTTGTTIAPTSGFATVAVGDLFVVALLSDDASGTYSCADDQSNTYQTDLARVINSGHISIVVFSAIAATAATTIPTVTHPSLTARVLSGWHLRGTDTTAGRLDGTPVSATGTGNAASGNLSVTSTSCYVGFSGYESDISNTYTNDSGFDTPASKDGTTGGSDASNITSITAVDLTPSSPDSYDTTNSASRSWVAALLAYKIPAVYVPRHPAINHQNPALLFKRWWQGWSRRPSGVLVPA